MTFKETNDFEIRPYDDQYRQQVLAVWEASVLATHDFLSPADFNEIKEVVNTIDFNAFEVYCLARQEQIAGFIGIADQKIEMLFLGPAYFGLGLGKMLMNFATSKLGANKVDVNEQNVKAVKFYQRFGFETFERTDKDDQGRNYPLYRMRLKR